MMIKMTKILKRQQTKNVETISSSCDGGLQSKGSCERYKKFN